MLSNTYVTMLKHVILLLLCVSLKKKKKNRIYVKCMYVCMYLHYICMYTLLLISFCTPVPHLPLLFQGVSASGLPTKSLSLTPIKDPFESFEPYTTKPPLPGLENCKINGDNTKDRFVLMNE